ncbi:Protein of unknown function [Filimonas lacunae]|uniref:DUF4197 domain-containing protein n=1 Tax=Filimonas lacunae TaxID=477680 RepID=A0A173MAT5_9BACT|nr:DUF4197 domain-containing protein [Filimonas lacunae]BAV04619.1 hypothetical protein FLA_0611 [Filimonas lacunae]SIT32629.1 Protein of unknown function [Filimonas lacunae]
MKRFFVLFSVALVSYGTSQAQLSKFLKKDTSSTSKSSGLSSLLKSVTGSGSSDSLSSSTIASGLKEALSQGVQKGTTKLSSVDGFFKDAAVKILLPAEAQNVEKKLRSVGLGYMVDSAILTMNRAAEDASKSAAPIFVNAIKEMSITDAVGILKGSDTAATTYLKVKTTSPLAAAFKPVIETSLSKVGATKHWNTLITAYNKIPLVSKINPDLSAYVTEKALTGVFYQVGQEEKAIRKDPVARTTDLLKTVFGSSK